MHSTSALRAAAVSAVAALVILLSPAQGARAAGQAADALLQRAAALMARTPLIDGHNDFPWEMRVRVNYDASKIDIRQPQPSLQTDIPRLRAGKVGGQLWSVYVPASMAGQTAVVATLEQMAFVHEMARRYPDTFEIASTAADMERIFKAGKIGSMMGVEGGHSIDSSLPTLRMLYKLGARYMTLTHNSNTPWADAANDKPEHDGLTAFGETVVREMNWLGMLVDLSHVSPRAMARALDVTEAPVMFSHSSARAICDVPRNVPDDILARMPKNGGVVMVNFYNGFVPPACSSPATPRRRRPPSASGRKRTRPSRRWHRWPTTSTTSARWPASITSASGATSTASTASRRRASRTCRRTPRSWPNCCAAATPTPMRRR